VTGAESSRSNPSSGLRQSAAAPRGVLRPMRGTRFGKYTLLNRIAVGGMAEIFLARQAGVEGFEKIICLKRIRPHLSSQPAFVNMVLNEAKLAAQLNRVGQSFFIAMEYISGRDMSRIIPKAEKKGIPFPLVYALKIASSVLEGLYYAHNRTDAYGQPLNIVHRDITPENIVVSFTGNVKILDFGIAKATSQLEQTRAGEIKGKLSYMSPEQCLGQVLDHRSDVFSIGVVLYEWVTGYKLFTGENEMAILKAIVDGKIYPPSYFKEDVPEAIERILLKALEKDREKRYQSAWDMQLDIDTFLGGHEFTPSNIHLSNFIKQLFEDELEVDQVQLMRAAQARIEDFEQKVVEPEEVGARALSEPGGDEDEVRGESFLRQGDGESSDHRTQISRSGSAPTQTVPVRMSRDELSGLEELARARRATVDEIVRDMVRAFLKYR
jgi:serine/threonine-protein kinase